MGRMGDGGDGFQPVSGQQETTLTNFICQSSAPSVAFFHLIFKTAAMVLYLFHSLLSGSFVLTFVLLVLLHAFDFWTTKNVSGRLLVGLRWHTRVNDNGDTEWHYESHPQGDQFAKPLDKRIFWGGIFVSTAFW